jgi:hypothetical protein
MLWRHFDFNFIVDSTGIYILGPVWEYQSIDDPAFLRRFWWVLAYFVEDPRHENEKCVPTNFRLPCSASRQC